jgi:hypothetical protein
LAGLLTLDCLSIAQQRHRRAWRGHYACANKASISPSFWSVLKRGVVLDLPQGQQGALHVYVAEFSVSMQK